MPGFAKASAIHEREVREPQRLKFLMGHQAQFSRQTRRSEGSMIERRVLMEQERVETFGLQLDAT